MSNPVLSLLIEKGVPYSISGKDYVVKCFNPEHSDSTPSFRIDRLTGVAHCFSCGYKTNIFKFYGLLTNNVSIRVAKIRAKLRALHESTNGLDMLDGVKPYLKVFRDISVKTLKEFGAFYTDSIEPMADRVIFPIKDVRSKTVAFVGRAIRTDQGARYLNYPPDASIPLFPAKFNTRVSSIVLVEGLFDMLNCYDKGLTNVVCTFGTNKLLADVPSKMLSYKVMGIEKVYILYDGDTAGREAAKKIKPLIEEAGFIVEIIDLPDDVDPGNLDDENIKSLIEYTK